MGDIQNTTWKAKKQARRLPPAGGGGGVNAGEHFHPGRRSLPSQVV